MNITRRRRLVLALTTLILFFLIILIKTPIENKSVDYKNNQKDVSYNQELAIDILNRLTVKGRAPKTNYSREQFGNGWATVSGCDTRNIILARDLLKVTTNDSCQVISGLLNDPYSGKIINFVRGEDTSSLIQIDHVVALSDAWQKGAQQLTFDERVALANDPLELLAVDGKSNQDKGGGDAATWLPSNKAFRCQYISRQIAVKKKYKLWITQAEYDAMSNILTKCPEQLLPNP